LLWSHVVHGPVPMDSRAVKVEAAAANLSVPRTHRLSMVEAPSWRWRACGGAQPMYPPSVCLRTYCLLSPLRHGVAVDLFDHLFGPVAPALAKLCSKASGGQVGQTGPVEVSFVVAHNGSDAQIVQCVAELLRTAREANSVEFILVDDGTARPTAAVDAVLQVLIEDFGLHVVHVRNPQPISQRAAYNLGAKRATGKYVALMEDSVVVSSGWLRAMLDTLKADGRAGLVGPLIVDSAGSVVAAGGVVFSNGTSASVGHHTPPNQYHVYRRDVDFLSASCVLLERALFLEASTLLGGFVHSLPCALHPHRAASWTHLLSACTTTSLAVTAKKPTPRFPSCRWAASTKPTPSWCFKTSISPSNSLRVACPSLTSPPLWW
jgi:hypothetical protein